MNADRKSLEKWFAAYGFKLLPKKAEENLFSSLITSDTPNQKVSNNFFDDIKIIKEEDENAQTVKTE